MQKNHLISVKAKLFISCGFLIVILLLAGVHLLAQERAMLSALKYNDDLKETENAIDSTIGQLGNLMTETAQVMAMPLNKDGTRLNEDMEKSRKEIEGLRNIDRQSVDMALPLLQGAQDAAFKNGSVNASNLKKSFELIKDSRSKIIQIDKTIDAQADVMHARIERQVENNLYNSLLIMLLTLLVVTALILMVIIEIFLPLDRIKRHLCNTANDIENIQNHIIKDMRGGEAGDTQEAFNKLIRHVAANFQALRDANMKATRRLAAIEAIRDGVGMVDADGTLTYANHALLTLHGITGQDAAGYIGKSWNLLYSDKGRELIERNVLPVLRDKGYWVGETAILRKDGIVSDMEMSLTLLDDGSMIGTARDITRRRSAEREREELQALFAQSQKMEAVGRLTGGVAHDFNNILTIIDGNMELLQDYRPNEPSDFDECVATVKRAVTRGAELTQRLLSFSRKQVLNPLVLDLNKILPDTMKLAEKAVDENIELRLDPAEDTWKVNIDAGQMENALLNLVINARDAMPEGGTITVSTENAWLGGQESRGMFNVKPGPYVKISIADTGHGIPQNIIANVFDPFFTTKPNGKGTGLGLSMVYGFVKQSGGYAFIDSRENAGTTVSLYFPRHEAEASEPLCIETVLIKAERSGSEIILLAEDEEDLRNLGKNMLTRLGYRVLCAPNGTEAFRIFQETERIDLVLTDMVMPGGMGGRELADKVHTLRPGTPVLVVSGYACGNVNELAIGPYLHFLSKPYTQAHLASEIRDLLNTRMENNSMEAL